MSLWSVEFHARGIEMNILNIPLDMEMSSNDAETLFHWSLRNASRDC
jgi:hypothetical protein